MQYQALWACPNNNCEIEATIEQRDTSELPENELLIRVEYSSLNYKDMLSANGSPGVTKKYPHQPGIDAAGFVESSQHPDFKAGDKVIVCGYDLGMNTPGGLGQYISVPAKWAVALPTGLSTKDAMSFGTAGFTAALCIEKLINCGHAKPEDGLVAVTGATGGVGSFAISLLSKLGFQVCAITGKAEQSESYLKSLGATEIMTRSELLAIKRPVDKPRFAHAVDALGGEHLANLLKIINYYGSVSCCGLADSLSLDTSMIPFILRGVNLLGVDCVELPIAKKAATWKLLGGDWQLNNLETMCNEIRLKDVPQALLSIEQGTAVGRYLVNLSDS